MKQTFIALSIFALVGAVIVAVNGQSDAASDTGVLAQSNEQLDPETLEPESDDDPAFSVSGDLTITLPDAAAEMAGDALACINESESVTATLADGVLTLQISELDQEGVHSLMKECGLPGFGKGHRGHKFDGPRGFGEFDLRGPFGDRFEGFIDGFGLSEEMQEQLEAAKECFESSAGDAGAIEACMAELGIEGLPFGRGFGEFREELREGLGGFLEGFDLPEEMQEHLDAVKECFDTAAGNREALENCIGQLDLGEFEIFPGRGFHFFDESFDVEPEDDGDSA